MEDEGRGHGGPVGVAQSVGTMPTTEETPNTQASRAVQQPIPAGLSSATLEPAWQAHAESVNSGRKGGGRRATAWASTPQGHSSNHRCSVSHPLVTATDTGLCTPPLQRWSTRSLGHRGSAGALPLGRVAPPRLEQISPWDGSALPASHPVPSGSQDHGCLTDIKAQLPKFGQF